MQDEHFLAKENIEDDEGRANRLGKKKM